MGWAHTEREKVVWRVDCRMGLGSPIPLGLLVNGLPRRKVIGIMSRAIPPRTT